jgi:ribosome-associated toxin RatA of RatAB toxin-antitoxin module
MDLHFKDTQPVNASGDTLWEVITDYPSYPSFNPAVATMTVLRKDEEGAEFVADMRSRVGKTAHASDRYVREGDFAIVRTYEGLEGSSQWTVHPVDADRSELSLEGTITVPLLKGLMMKPMLRRMVHRMDFEPFIREAERRANGAGTTESR